MHKDLNDELKCRPDYYDDYDREMAEDELAGWEPGNFLFRPKQVKQGNEFCVISVRSFDDEFDQIAPYHHFIVHIDHGWHKSITLYYKIEKNFFLEES